LGKGRATPGLFLTDLSDGRLVQPGLSSRDHEALTAFPPKDGGKPTVTNFSAASTVHDNSVKGSNKMENIFLTTLLVSVVIGVLIIYHVTPEG
jgi:hypothetical protein